MAKQKLEWRPLAMASLPDALRKEAEGILKAQAELSERRKKFDAAFFKASSTLDADLWVLGWNFGKLSIARLTEPKSAKQSADAITFS